MTTFAPQVTSGREWIPGTPEYAARQLKGFVGGITNIINTAKTAATSFVQQVSAQANIAVNQAKPTIGQPLASYPVPQAYANPLPIPPGGVPVFTGYSTPAQVYNYNPSTNQPISITINPQPINITVPGSNIPVIGPLLPSLEQALAPFIASIGQVVSPLINIANKTTNNQFLDLELKVDKAVRDATAVYKSQIDNLRTEVDRNTRDVREKFGNSVYEANQIIAEAKSKLDADWVRKQLELNGSVKDAARIFQDKLDQITRGNTIVNEATKKIDDEKKAIADKQQLDFFTQVQKTIKDIGDFFTALSGLLDISPGKKGKTFSDVLRDASDSTIKGYDSVLQDIKSGKLSNFSEFINRLHTVGADDKVLWSAVNVFAVIGIFLTALKSSAEPYGERIQQLANADIQHRLLGVSDYVEALYRLPSQRKWIFEQLHKLGLSDEQIAVVTNIAINVATPDQIVAANLRGIIDDNVKERLLTNLRIDDENINILSKLAFFIPPIQDQIRFLVKEGYNEDAIRRYQLDSPEYRELIPTGKKLGLSEEWIRRYWVSHWEYPSPTMVYRMFHLRNLIPDLKGFSQDDVFDYLRLADYSPAWRSKMLAIAYGTLGRIDIRRIYKAGGKDDNWLRIHYEAEGYNPQDVNDLVKWTKETQLPEDENELSKLNDKLERLVESRYIAGAMNATEATNILKYLQKSQRFIDRALPMWDLMKQVAGLENEQANLSERIKLSVISAKTRGNISTAVARKLLTTAGMTDNQANMNLLYADLQYEIKLKEKAQDTFQQQYAVHNIEDEEFINGLKEYEFSTTEITRAIKEAKLMRINKTKKPTQQQLEKWHKSGIIDDTEFANELRGIGYAEKYVQIYLEKPDDTLQ